jgi:hypothetical protein
LKVTLDELILEFPSSVIFVRGDANSSRANAKRWKLLSDFCSEYKLSRVPVNHNTYHHFLGQGASDSELDVLLFSSKENVHEHLIDLRCQLQDPLIDSHHDVLVSSCTIPCQTRRPHQSSQNISAPRMENKRHKIIWSDEGIAKYKEITSMLLPGIRNRWLSSSSQASTSVLLQSTNFILSQAATIANRVVSLSVPMTIKSEKIPKDVRKSGNALARLSTELRKLKSSQTSSQESIECVQNKMKLLKIKHRKLVRWTRLQKNISRDSKLSSACSDGSKMSNAVRNRNCNTTRDIQELFVGDKIYEGKQVPDGFYDSISSLKKLDELALSTSSSFQSASEIYKNIIKICNSGTKVPAVSTQKAREILKTIRPSVNDYYSITVLLQLITCMGESLPWNTSASFLTV